MDIFEFLEAVLADVCLTIGEVLKMHLVEDHTQLYAVSGYLQQVKLIRPAEIIIAQHVFLLALHQQNSLRLYELTVDLTISRIKDWIGLWLIGCKKKYGDYNRLRMYNNFKNPFQMDDQDTIIKLDPVQAAQEQPLPFNPYKPEVNVGTTDSSRVESESSMFNALDDSLKQPVQPQLDEFDDPPLLQDIGIDIELIKRRIISIVSLGEADRQLITAPDLSGPILISFLLGILLLLGGKIHFSDILSYFVLGNGAMYLLFNCMAKDAEISYYSVMSFLGYSLLPMLPLAVLGIFLPLNSSFGVLTSLILSGWSSYTAGGMIALFLNREGKLLIVYPLFLFYLSFALIIIF